MTRAHPEPYQKEQLKHPCTTCGAQPGEWCRLQGRGRYATFNHANRMSQANAAREGRTR